MKTITLDLNGLNLAAFFILFVIMTALGGASVDASGFVFTAVDDDEKLYSEL